MFMVYGSLVAALHSPLGAALRSPPAPVWELGLSFRCEGLGLGYRV
jgi:hypothetical protein